MAMRFADPGGQYYATADITKVWSTNSGMTVSATAARLGTNGLLGNSGAVVSKVLDNQATWVVGFAVRAINFPGGSAVRLCQLTDVTTEQCGLYLDSIGRLSVRVAGTDLAVATTALSTDVWYYIEFKATINGTTGSYEVRVNGQGVGLSGSGVDTQVTANAYANVVVLFCPTTSYHFTDIVIMDSSGSVNNNFLGDVRVEPTFPNGNGNSSQWDGSDGNSTDNYLLVDEATPNGDTDYITTATVNDVDTYGYGNVTPTTGSVYAVIPAPYARKDDAGTRSIATVVRHSGTDYIGTTQPLSTSYQYLPQIYETNPGTSAAWTIAEVNAAEFGAKLVA